MEFVIVGVRAAILRSFGSADVCRLLLTCRLKLLRIIASALNEVIHSSRVNVVECPAGPVEVSYSLVNLIKPIVAVLRTVLTA